ncbi:hypothetical protein [Pseudomonas sp. NMI760_13]|uniref:hypothetical protein n=1 Tax=Pseudomonas sp. NMI760_13 TaxID=2903147 RepID=UPI001E2EB330|nr:hypothetical protein [Pseudomonas sp. NMI760_13]MCE0915640.1 hypothetical protein [Pseudomonas sp. NMI760_13]
MTNTTSKADQPLNALETRRPLSSPSDALDPAQIPITGAVSLGLGYAVRTNRMKNGAVIDNSTPKPNMSVRPDYAFEYVENYSELSEALNVSASASYGSSGVSGGSASLSMMKSTTMRSDCAYVAVKARFIAKESTIVNAYLSDETLDILNGQSAAEFYDKFGSKFIRTLYHGGELACVLEFSSTETRSSEEFRAEIKAAVGAAKGEASMESKVTSLVGGRRVHIKYAQSGGKIGTPEAGGIYTATPTDLIKRMQVFASEVYGATGLDGSTVPIFADLMGYSEAKNWPSQKHIDLESPYPPAIDNIARSILILEDQTALVRGMLSPTAATSPGLVAAAQEMTPYLEFATAEAKNALRNMMNNASGTTEYYGESFLQYRLRNLLQVSSAAYSGNAGGAIDFGEKDKNLLKALLFGVAESIPISPWPKLEISGSWGFQGERDDWGTGTRVPCPAHGGSIQSTAEALAGKTGPNDGRFGFAQPYPTSYRGGGNCGYTVIHFTAIKVIHSDSNPLPPLPMLPATPANGVSFTIGKPFQKEVNHWWIPFNVTMPCTTSCGKYELTGKLISQSGEIKEFKEISYWYKTGDANLSLEHPLMLDAGWIIHSVEGSVHTALCS